MADRISSLPDEALCYILSFLPTKVAVATSVLSKRWKLLWRSVPTLDFDYCDYRNDIHENRNETYSRFVHSVYAFILSRNLDQPLQRFCLRCEASLCDTATVSTWLTAAAQRRVERLDLYLSVRIDIPLAVISCKTLVVLKLTELKVNALSSVDFPSLKILHLDCVEFSERRHLAELLSGSPNLEDLETKVVDFIRDETGGTFKRLPKLRRAFIIFNAVPLEVVYNVQFLHIHDLVGEDIEEHIPEFHNLTHIEFTYFDYYEYGLDVFQVLRCCPKLQHLSIDKKNLEMSPVFNLGEDWPCPQCVPKCISLHLKTCCLVKYTGTGGEFEFAKYIMQNARVLQDMTICTYTTEEEQEQLEMMKEKFELIKELSLCTRISPTCKLSFNWYTEPY